MKVHKPLFAIADDVWDGLALIAHRLHIQVELAGGVIDGFAEVDAFLCRVHEVGLLPSQGLHGNGGTVLTCHLSHAAHDVDSAFEGIIHVPLRKQIAGLGAAPDHHLATQSTAEAAHVLAKLHHVLAQHRVRGGHAEPERSGEKPVQPDDLQTEGICDPDQPGGICQGQIPGILLQCKRGQFQPFKATSRRFFTHLFKWCIAPMFIADRKTHGRACRRAAGRWQLFQ
ncbi:MAG TPA: hypothetical protein VK956_09285 [Verrucomicrobium sp.]|nr:hypothetical protein [Verrucomicrobium sp.]